MEVTQKEILSELVEMNELASTITGEMKRLRIEAQRLMGKRKTLKKDAAMANSVIRRSSEGHPPKGRRDLLVEADEVDEQVKAINEDIHRLRRKLQVLTAERQRLRQHLDVLDKNTVLACDMRAREKGSNGAVSSLADTGH